MKIKSITFVIISGLAINFAHADITCSTSNTGTTTYRDNKGNTVKSRTSNTGTTTYRDNKGNTTTCRKSNTGTTSCKGNWTFHFSLIKLV